MTTYLHCMSACLVLFFSVSSFSEPIQVNFLESQYATFARTAVTNIYDEMSNITSDITYKSRVTSSSNTTSDYLEDNGFHINNGEIIEIASYANAGTFANITEVSVNTNSWGGGEYAFSQADAKTTISFSPVLNQIIPMQFDLFFWDLGFYFSESEIKITDLTTDQNILDFSRDMVQNIDWNWDETGSMNDTDPLWIQFGRPSGYYSLSLAPEFVKDHNYMLSIFASANSNEDSEGLAIRMSGFNPVSAVPEPSGLALLVISLGVLSFVKCNYGKKRFSGNRR